MNRRKLATLVITLVSAVIVIAGTLVWIQVKRGEKFEIPVNIIEIGMSEKDVFRIWGDPDETVLARSGDRNSSHVIYAYDLESGETIHVVFDPDLRGIEVLKTDNSWTCLADISSGIGTQIKVDFSTGEYEVIKPNYSFLFENSPISAEQVCQLEVGMIDSLVQVTLGTPEKIIENEPPIISIDYIYYLNEEYQLDITIINNRLHNVQLKNQEGNFLLWLLPTSAEGARISFDDNKGTFGRLYPSANLRLISNSDLLQLNNVIKGMTVDEVNTELDKLGIKKTQEDISPYRHFFYYSNNRNIVEITYELGQSAVLEMVFQDELVLARIILNNGNDGSYYLLDYADPIGTRIHYDLNTGYLSKMLPE